MNKETNHLTLWILLITNIVVSNIKYAKADFTFGEPQNLGSTINSPSGDDGLTISSDGLTMFFGSNRTGSWDLWMASRETTEDTWSTPENLGFPVNNPDSGESYPSISVDGLELFFCSIYWGHQRPGGSGGGDLWVTRRASISDPWGTPENLGPVVNSASHESEPSISADGLELYFSSQRPGGGDMNLYFTMRPTKNEPWGEPVNLGPLVNSSADDMNPCISADGLTLFFRSGRSGGYGRSDIYLTTRATTSDPWGEPVNLGPIINNSATQVAHYISPDGSILYLDTSGPSMGSYDLWQVSIIPIVDFNGDEITDATDMRIMIEHWGENYSLCDIGPMPWGDGIVDVQDFIVLAEHIEPELRDPALIAYWKLDEKAGNTAYDSIGSYNSILHGESLWQPDGGKVGGALQFDGIDDYVSVPFVLNPGVGSFSVFTWLKGGTPGQAILSQSTSTSVLSSTWLGIDPLDGKLITKLMHPPFPPLESDSVITDVQWHHVGLVYNRDTLHRHLYVDGAEVTKDISPVAALGSDGGLYIGADEILDATSFFSGLIDDVRVYNDVLSLEEIEALAQ